MPKEDKNKVLERVSERQGKISTSIKILLRNILKLGKFLVVICKIK